MSRLLKHYFIKSEQLPPLLSSTQGHHRRTMPLLLQVTLGQRGWAILAAPLFFPSRVGSKETWDETEKLHHSGRMGEKNGFSLVESFKIFK